MSKFFSVILALLVAFGAKINAELCNHESGGIHVFWGENCEGDHHHHSEHDHHSHDHDQGEHHEPCEHTIISTDWEFAQTHANVSVNSFPEVTFVPGKVYHTNENLSHRFEENSRLKARAPPLIPCGLVQYTRSVRFLN